MKKCKYTMKTHDLVFDKYFCKENNIIWLAILAFYSLGVLTWDSATYTIQSMINSEKGGLVSLLFWVNFLDQIFIDSLLKCYTSVSNLVKESYFSKKTFWLERLYF